MQVNLFEQKGLAEDRMDLYYEHLTPGLERIISLAKNEIPVIRGKIDGEEYRLKIEKVLYFDAVDKKVFGYSANRVFQIEFTLNQLEELLGNFGFLRINKSNIVNLYQVEKIYPDVNMRVKVQLCSGEKLIINRTYKAKFQQELMRLWKGDCDEDI